MSNVFKWRPWVEEEPSLVYKNKRGFSRSIY